MKEERYEIVDDSHGEGGFGKVSKQRDTILDRFVAVKELHLIDDDEAKKRFEREAKVLAKMSHPNVPAIYDVRFEDDKMEIIFEFMEGTSLKSIISPESVPSMSRIKRWFIQLGAALEHAHKLGLTHRDVKPDNVIISDNDENAFLVDFGIALTRDDAAAITKTGYAIGTPGYMSPEQSEGEDVDHRSDLYSLGITLYEVISGHLPHAGGYQSLSDANEAIPPAIDELIKDCIARDKNARLESASVFIERLRSAFRTDAPLSELLTEARLHELITALSTLSAEDFATKPAGQRLLLIRRLDDLIRSDEPGLRTATAQFIASLTRLAPLESEQNYRPIVDAAMHWGFNKHYGKYQGEQDVRTAIIDAARIAGDQAHKVIAESFLDFARDIDFSAKQGWFNHDIRQIAMILLANPKCGGVAGELAKVYDDVNKASH